MNTDVFTLGMKFSYRRDRGQPWVTATVYQIDRDRNHLYAELDISPDIMWPRIILNMADPNVWDQIGIPTTTKITHSPANG